MQHLHWIQNCMSTQIASSLWFLAVARDQLQNTTETSSAEPTQDLTSSEAKLKMLRLTQLKPVAILNQLQIRLNLNWLKQSMLQLNHLLKWKNWSKEPAEFSLNANIAKAEISEFEEESSILDEHLHEQQRVDEESALSTAVEFIALNIYPERRVLSGEKNLKSAA